MIVQRNTSNIFGLDATLTNLTTKGNTLEARIADEESRAASEEQRIETKLENNVERLEGSIGANNTSSINRDNFLQGKLDIIQGSDATDGSIAKAEKNAKEFAQSLVGVANENVNTIENVINVINGSSDTDGSFRKAIKDVIGAAPEALNTISELADAINNNPDLYNTITALISSNISAAKDELKGSVSQAFDTFKEIEDALSKINGADNISGSIAKSEKNAKEFATAEIVAERTRAENIELGKMDKDGNLSDVQDKNAARLNLNVYSKSETDASIRLGGAIFVTEIQNVASDKITLNHIAKNNMIFNFSTVRHVDGDMVSWDIPVTNISGAEYQLHPNYTGQFDNKPVMVQYAYVSDV